MHKLLRKYELFYDLTLEENIIKFKKTDPNTFPIYDLTYKAKSENDYESISNILLDFKDNFEEMCGFNLYIHKSKIRHMSSQDGVFLSCKKKQSVLPGTLVGFYPGIIYPSRIKKPELIINDTYPYLKRFDDFWVDPIGLVPYPLYDNLSIEDFKELKKTNSNLLYKELPLYKNNHLALGHKINHCPPDEPANVKIIDFYVSSNFFPKTFFRYLPNIKHSDDSTFELSSMISYKGTHNETKIRLIGIVSLKEIKHGEELYADYIQEDMIPISYKPDWLIKPPDNIPYLTKETYVTKNKILDKLLFSYYNITKNEELEEFKAFQKLISNEGSNDIAKSRQAVKDIQKRLKEAKNVNDNTKRLL
jgi:hypothetical protein